ncbi:hypothetical protein CLV63_12049 [Murinocardiopsis flavida]|uniref:Uncharacterized protein n=1 Tax=Murinocardiopsis flavida TaxID=645275 RepID=A0A2P8D267_9ACTN|nr:hypothetical protein [Murinocardiopsis flavida]PSK91323.1 hypothetical protein CLV63_12049 [Murinocardiopsis flavida]
MAPPRPPYRARPPAADPGRIHIEYTMGITLAVAVAAVAGYLFLPPNATASVDRAVCGLLNPSESDNGGCTGGAAEARSNAAAAPPSSCTGDGASAADAELRPDLCPVLYDAGWSRTATSAAVVALGGDLAFLRQELPDGTVRLTAMSDDGFGAKGKGADRAVTSGDAALGGKLPGDPPWRAGDAFAFRGPGAAKEADRVQHAAADYLKQQACDDGSAETPQACPKEPADLKDLAKKVGDPQITAESVPGSLGFGAKAKSGTLDLGLLGGKGRLSGATLEEVDATDPDHPTTARTYSFTAKGKHNVGLFSLGAKERKDVALRLVRDDKGRLTSVRVAETIATPDGAGLDTEAAGEPAPSPPPSGAGGKNGLYETRSAALAVDDGNRDDVEDWLRSGGGGKHRDSEFGVPAVSGDDGAVQDRVKQQFYERGRIGRVLYETERSTGSTPFGLSMLGAGSVLPAAWGDEKRAASKAEFLGAPDDMGPRVWLDFGECAAHQDGGGNDAPDPSSEPDPAPAAAADAECRPENENEPE